ncbi:MAG: TonB-dependent siderophore receptor [Pseudomonadota bacterium]
MTHPVSSRAFQTFRLRAIAGAAALLSFASAHAQSTPPLATSTTQITPAVTLKEVTVTAEQEATTEGSGSYTTHGTTIGKGLRSLRETPQSVTVLTRQRLDDQGIRTLDSALQATTGITVQESSSHERTFFSRGFEIDTIQYDGVPTTRGSGFFISPDLSGYDRVEVLRGPAGLFNGAGQPGGTVNLVRKRPLATRQLNAQVTLGSWNLRRAEGDISLVLNDAGSLRGRLVAAREERNFFYDVANSKRTVLYGVVEADIGPRTTLGAGFNYEKNAGTPFYGGLPRFSDGRDLKLPRSTYLNAAWSRSDIQNTTYFTDLNHRFNDNWKVKLGVSRMKENNYDLSGAAFNTVNPATNLGPTISSFKANLLGEQTALDGTLEGSFLAFGRKHDVIFGTNYQYRDYRSTSQSFTVANAAINPFTFNPYNYANAPTVPAGAQTRTLNKTEQNGMYGSVRFALSDPMKLVLGGRTSYFKSSVQNLVTGVLTTQPYEEKSRFVPYGALSYDLDQNWTVYGSYAEIFRSQANLFTVAGTRLAPATGTTYEAGIKGALNGGKLNTSAALFRTTETNRAQTVVAANCAGNLINPAGACSAAEGQVLSQGLDAELSGEVAPRLQVAAGYTINLTRYVSDRNATGPTANVNQPLLTYAPRHMLRIWSNYQLTDALAGWSIGGGVNLQSKTYKVAGAARLEQPGYAVWSARVGYRINKNLTASLSLNNIFDKTYYRTLGALNGSSWYGEPRNVTATLQATF